MTEITNFGLSDTIDRPTAKSLCAIADINEITSQYLTGENQKGRALMEPYLVIVEDPSSDKLLNVAVIRAEHEQQADTKAQQSFSNMPGEDLCV